jgi:hypothetical protein
LAEWLGTEDKTSKMNAPMTGKIMNDVHAFYFNHYMNHFNTDGFRDALGTIPFNFIWDDHDIFDGYGSYPDYLSKSPIFVGVFEAALRFYLLFQHHTNVDRYKYEEIGDSSHSTLLAYGPFLAVVSIDVRSERTLEHVVPQRSWDMIWDGLYKLPPTCRHLIVNVTIPVAYPRIAGEGLFAFAADTVKKGKSFINSFQRLVVSKTSENPELDHDTWADAFSKTGAFKQIVNCIL